LTKAWKPKFQLSKNCRIRRPMIWRSAWSMNCALRALEHWIFHLPVKIGTSEIIWANRNSASVRISSSVEIGSRREE
jgi:hypothetical protein